VQNCSGTLNRPTRRGSDVVGLQGVVISDASLIDGCHARGGGGEDRLSGPRADYGLDPLGGVAFAARPAGVLVPAATSWCMLGIVAVAGFSCELPGCPHRRRHTG
jgi:hypothetical protein